MYAWPRGIKVGSKSKRTKQEEKKEDEEKKKEKKDIKIKSMLEMRVNKE